VSGPAPADDPRERLAAARLWAAHRQPYLASAIFAATTHLDPQCHTIAVDRSWNLHADPVKVLDLRTDDLGRLLLHLVGHLVRGHAERASRLGVAEDNAREWWNRVADAEINDDLVRVGARPPVADDLPATFEAPDRGLAETYYELDPAGPRRWDCGSGCDDGDRPWDRAGIDAQQCELLRLSVAGEIQRHDAHHPGTTPRGWLRWAEALVPSRVDWRRALAAEVRRSVASVSGRVDYTYSRRSRRAESAPHVGLPAQDRPTPEVAIVCDTSGSMHDALLARVLAEVEGILVRAGLRQGNVRVLAVDTNVHAVRRATRASDVVLAGGGGTDMGAGIHAAAALRPRPSVIVVLTDGHTPWPARPPRDVKIVVGVLAEWAYGAAPDPPSWARTILIDDRVGAGSQTLRR
jgi:predicted metal-dependent peptidase